MAKLNICIIQQSPDLGGAETYMLSLIGHFLKSKNLVTLITNNGKYYNLAKKNNISLIKSPVVLDYIGNKRGLVKSLFLTPFALFFYFKVLFKLKKSGINVILMSGFSEKVLVSFLSVFFRIPVVWIEYGPLNDIFNGNFHFPKLIYRLSKNIPRYVIVPSENTKKSLIIDARLSLARLVLIPLGIEFNKDKIKVELPSSWKKAIIIGNVSRLTVEKGQDILIKAMPFVLRKNKNVRLLIVGEGSDKSYFKNLAKKLNIEDKVFITGYVDNVSSYFKKMNLFVFSSVWKLEGFGLVLIEAMSNKLPIISSGIGPAPEIVLNNKTGLIVSPFNEKSLSEAIIKLISNKKLIKEFGAQGYERYIKEYKIEKSASKILNLLQEVV